MTILRYVTVGSIKEDLNEIVNLGPTIGLYVLSNLDICKQSVIFVCTDIVLFVYSKNYQFEDETRINFNSQLTELKISRFRHDIIAPNNTMVLEFVDSTYTFTELGYFSIDIIIKNILIERLFLTRKNAYNIPAVSIIETKVFVL